MVTDRLLSFGITWHYVGFYWHSSKNQNLIKPLSANYFAPIVSIQRIICNFVRVILIIDSQVAKVFRSCDHVVILASASSL